MCREGRQSETLFRLIQSIAAARQSTPMKDEGVFSYRVATARHSFRPNFDSDVGKAVSGQQLMGPQRAFSITDDGLR